MLELRNIAKQVAGEAHLSNISLKLEKGSLNVLLGPTLAGKTSLMRIMAGLDRPSSGHLLWNGAEVTGLPVQKRNVAMVYQQFINYPTLNVYENIASPLRIARQDADIIDARVKEVRGETVARRTGACAQRGDLSSRSYQTSVYSESQRQTPAAGHLNLA